MLDHRLVYFPPADILNCGDDVPRGVCFTLGVGFDPNTSMAQVLKGSFTVTGMSALVDWLSRQNC